MSSSPKKSLKQSSKSIANDKGEDVLGDLVPSRFASNVSLSKRPASSKSVRPSEKDPGKSKPASAASSVSDIKSSRRDIVSPSTSPLKTSPTMMDSPTEHPLGSANPMHKSARSVRRNSHQSQASAASSVFSGDHNNQQPIDDDDRGRVKVFVRLRPMSQDEMSLREDSVVGVDQSLRHVTVTDGKKDSSYYFDRVFDSKADHKEIFNVIGKPVVHSALKGFNGTLMAYGQTGTGKTHTLTSSDGLIPRLVNYLFRRVAQDSDEYEYRVKCSSIQIYNEKIYDLLLNQKKQSSSVSGSTLNMEGELNLRENPDKGVFVEDLTEYIVRSPKEVFELMKIARSRLVFAETKMNRASSRSHAITFLSVEKASNKSKKKIFDMDENIDDIPQYEGEGQDYYDFTDKEEIDDEEDEVPLSPPDDNLKILNDYVLKGRITLCDLAGSERIKKTMATGDRLNEAQQINLSLLELGNVIHALTDPKRTHVPFRNSTLTRLLTESLGGNCLTRLIVCVGPCAKDYSETKGTLMFGMRAMKVKNNARVNMEVDYKAMADSLERQLIEKEEFWRRKEAEWQAKINEIVDDRLQEDAKNRNEVEDQLKAAEMGFKQIQEVNENLKIQLQEYQELITKLSSWMSSNDAQIWLSIQAALYCLEQSIIDQTNHAKFSSSVKVHVTQVKEKSAFTPKSLSQLIEWLDEVNSFPDSPVVMEKWLAIAPSIFSSLNGNLKQHMETIGNLGGDAKEFSKALGRLLHGSSLIDSPNSVPSSIHELLKGFKDTKPLHFIAVVPLIFQFQFADRLLSSTYALAHVINKSTNETRFKNNNGNNAFGTDEKFAQTEKTRDRDIDDLLDRKADKKAAACRVGGKECSIM